MATLQQMVQVVRMVCAEPRPQAPATRAIFNSVLRTTQSLFNQLSNTNHAWATGETVLTVTPNVEDYDIGEADFGKALSIITINAANPSHIERLVDFFEVQNISVDWNLPNDAGNWMINWDGSNHTAQRMAFFRQAGQDNTYVRVKPVPKHIAEYRILYSIGNWVDAASLNSSPLLSEHHHLIAVRAALNVLPLCSWWDEEVLNQNRRKELALSLKNEEALYATDWSRYIGNMRVDHMTNRFIASID